MAAFLNFSPSGRDQSEGAGCGNSFFPQPARTGFEPAISTASLFPNQHHRIADADDSGRARAGEDADASLMMHRGGALGEIGGLWTFA